MSSFLTLTMESIKQQSDRLFKALTKTFSDAKGLPIDQINGSGLMDELSGLVKSAMNLPVKFSVSKEDSRYDELNIFFFDPRYMGNKSKVKDEIVTIAKLTFDLNNAKVLGDTNKIAAQCEIPQRFFKDKALKPEWAAAAVLHELGHLYVELMMIGSMERSNQAISRIAKDFDNNAAFAQRKTHYVQAFKQTNLRPDQIEKLAKTDSLETLVTTAYEDVAGNVVHLLGATNYDTTISENVADEFAVRFGAGKALAEMNAYLFDTSTKLQSKYDRRIYYLTASWMVLAMIYASVVLTQPAFLAFWIVSLTTFFFFHRPSSMHNVSYDTDLDRNIRIRNQMQLRMRQLTTNSDEYQRFKAELDQVDILIKGMTKYKPFYAELGDSVFFNWFRKWSQQGRLEKTIEATGYNSLYDKALQIKFA